MKYAGSEKAQYNNLRPRCPRPDLGDIPQVCVPTHTFAVFSVLGEERKVQRTQISRTQGSDSRRCWHCPQADEARYSSCRHCRTEARTMVHRGEDISPETREERGSIQHPDKAPYTHLATQTTS